MPLCHAHRRNRLRLDSHLQPPVHVAQRSNEREVHVLQEKNGEARAYETASGRGAAYERLRARDGAKREAVAPSGVASACGGLKRNDGSSDGVRVAPGVPRVSTAGEGKCSAGRQSEVVLRDVQARSQAPEAVRTHGKRIGKVDLDHEIRLIELCSVRLVRLCGAERGEGTPGLAPRLDEHGMPQPRRATTLGSAAHLALPDRMKRCRVICHGRRPKGARVKQIEQPTRVVARLLSRCRVHIRKLHERVQQDVA